MKHLKHIAFNYRGINTRTMVSILRACRIKDPDASELRELAQAGMTLVDVTLEAGDDRLPQLLTAMHSRGIECAIRDEIKYDAADLAASAFLWLHVARNAIGCAGPFHETLYDTSNACPRCFAGAVQTSALRLAPRDLPKAAKVVEVAGGGLIMDKSVAVAIHAELGTIRGTRQCEDRRSKRKLPWWQILPDTTLPPLDQFTPGITAEDQCPACRRSGFFDDIDTPLKPIYRLTPAQASELPDFLSTWECFGHSNLDPEHDEYPGYALPYTIVSNRVMQILKRHRISKLTFTPVLIQPPSIG